MRIDEGPPEPLGQALGFLLSWNGQRMARRFAAALEPLGLKPPHFGVLRILEAAPGMTQQELVERSLIDPSSMVKVVDELEELGLAERSIHPEDRRRRVVELTARGRRTLARAREIADAAVDDVLAPLDADERETLRRLLRKAAGAEDD